MLTFEEAILLPRSEKVILCIARATTQYKIFTVHSGSVYVKDVDYWVDSVKQGATSLTAALSTSLSAGQFYFSPTEKKLYVRMTDSSNPKTKAISVTHKFFFSDAPLILPNDLSTGVQVPFEPLVNSIGTLGQQLDDENTGIVLESSSTIEFINNSGFFDNIFDFIWENKQVDFYSWFPSIPISEAQRIFSGVVEAKDFSQDRVTFRVKDFVYRLKNEVSLRVFSDGDGNVNPSFIGTPKRRVYGQAQQMKCVGVDNVLGGYFLTGTFVGTLGSKTVTGTGSLLLSEASPGDEFIIVVDDETVKLQIDSITSNTSFELGEESEIDFSVASATLKPARPYRMKNRNWHIAGHLLYAPSAEITQVQTNTRFVVDDTSGFIEGDLIKINTDYTRVRRVSGNVIVTTQAISPLPSIGDFVEKSPVSKAQFGSRTLVIDRDYSLDNGGNDAILEIDPLAEFNIAPQRSFSVQLLWTNASRSVTTIGGGDLRTLVSTRDWIRKDRLDEATWYEVLSVSEQEIVLRIAFSGTTETIDSFYKPVEYIDDNSLITVDCMGYEDTIHNGGWIKTASDAARHLCLFDAEFASVNEASFAKAKSDCSFRLSMVIPETIGSKAPLIRDVITKINESVFGSLYLNNNIEVAYSILNARRPESLLPLKDDDILSWDVSSNQTIANVVKISYRPFVDVFNGEDSFLYKEHTSSFVNNLVGIKNTITKVVYLYDESAATIIVQRLAFFNSLSQSKVSVKTKMNLVNHVVGDKVYLDLDRLYKRYGNVDRKKIGIINSIKKNGRDCDVEFIDLGNIFNRVACIAANDTPVYPATENDVVLFGFIVDNDTETPDVTSEIGLGSHLIG